MRRAIAAILLVLSLAACGDSGTPARRQRHTAADGAKVHYRPNARR
jgi:predicted small lipoprotein YifL